MDLLETYMTDIRRDIDHQLDQLLPSATTPPIKLHEAMRYSVFAGGKRLRPALCIASCEALGGKREDALLAAAAIESLHTYTLIHDDLPAMDNDDMRRGKPSCHTVFDEATAILAGDALLTFAFELLGKTGNSRLVTEMAFATGSLGTIGGQSDDMQSKTKKLSHEEIVSIHERKTGMLFSASCRLGAIAARASDVDIDLIGYWAKALGIVFQLLDDICDNDPVTMNTFTRESAITKAKEYERTAEDFLKKFSGNTEILHALAHQIISPFGI